MAEAHKDKIKNQATRVWGFIRSDATGDLLTGGLGTLAGTVFIDGASGVSTTTPVEAPANSGVFYVDLTAGNMNGECITLKVTASAANAMDYVETIYTLSTEQYVGEWLSDTSKRPEELILQMATYILGKTAQSNSSGTITVYKTDGTTAIGTRTWTNTGNSIELGKLA